MPKYPRGERKCCWFDFFVWFAGKGRVEMEKCGDNTSTPAARSEGGNNNLSLPPQPVKMKRVAPSKKKESTTRSQIWKHFIGDGNPTNPRAKCMYCDSSFRCSTTVGTSSMWKHFKTCKKSPYRVIDKSQPTIEQCHSKVKGEGDGEGTSKKVVYNVDEIRRAIAEMIIIDENPFSIVEKEGFRKLMGKCLPGFQMPSRFTCVRDCFKIYREEKRKLKQLLRSQRVCLTSDCWTSIQNLNYMVITAHWIDDGWNLQKRILNFCQIPDHKGDTIGKGIEACLLQWGIEKFLTVTLDNASSNDAAIRYLKRRTKEWKDIVLGNECLHMRCCAHILNLIVRDGLNDHNDSICKVRNAVRYVRSSPSRFATFKSYVEKEKINANGFLSLDCETRWNSTFHMLEAAEKFHKAFDRMFEDDAKYREYFKSGIGESDRNGRLLGPPNDIDWKNVEIFIKFLRLFYHVTLKFSSSLHVTSNIFFHEYFSIQKALNIYANGGDCILSDMAIRMQLKFDKYWGNIKNMNMLLFVAVVLDPRYKLKYVKFSFKELYGVSKSLELSEMVENALVQLYNFYIEKDESSQVLGGEIGISMNTNICVNDMVDPSKMWQSQWKKQLEEEENVVNHTEVERYLEVGPFKGSFDSFDMLSWWKSESDKFPILSKVARDVLALPISTVSSESAFSTSGRILDSFRSSMTTKTVEALVCTQQWIRSNSTPSNLGDLLEDIEKIGNIEKEFPDTVLNID